jgi:hypothetical protein
MARRRKRWTGDYITVWSDNSWEYFRCCHCGKMLDDAASRKRGLGPECKDRVPVDQVIAIKNQERGQMRAWLEKQQPKRTARRSARRYLPPLRRNGRPAMHRQAWRTAEAFTRGAAPTRDRARGATAEKTTLTPRSFLGGRPPEPAPSSFYFSPRSRSSRSFAHNWPEWRKRRSTAGNAGVISGTPNGAVT